MLGNASQSIHALPDTISAFLNDKAFQRMSDDERTERIKGSCIIRELKGHAIGKDVMRSRIMICKQRFNRLCADEERIESRIRESELPCHGALFLMRDVLLALKKHPLELGRYQFRIDIGVRMYGVPWRLPGELKMRDVNVLEDISCGVDAKCSELFRKSECEDVLDVLVEDNIPSPERMRDATSEI